MNSRLPLAALALLTAACTPGWTGTSPEPVTPETAVRVPGVLASYRVIESATGREVSFASMVDHASRADVVFFGEQHDDPETHFLEFALLDGLGKRQSNVVLSLEMFERDVQPALENYLRGAVSESLFLARSRPWPRYATDYRTMVQLARARGWKVIAANIPRPMASAIARKGMPALDTLTTTERAYAAASMVCPTDDRYFQLFKQAMGGHGAGGGPPSASDAAAADAMTVRFYEAQCAKDETMAESIARELMATQRGRGVVLHVNGAFHSDYGLGTASRVQRRMPDARVLVITAVPVANPATAAASGEVKKADYVIFTRSGK